MKRKLGHNSVTMAAMKNIFLRCGQSRRGAAAVEFAILVPVIAALLTGLANYGLAMFDKMELTSAARAGAQAALINSSDTTTIKSTVVNSTNLNISTTDVTTTSFCECGENPGTTITCGDSCTDGSLTFMTVSVSENFTLLILGTTITLTGSATVRTN